MLISCTKKNREIAYISKKYLGIFVTISDTRQQNVVIECNVSIFTDPIYFQVEEGNQTFTSFGHTGSLTKMVSVTFDRG